MRFPGSRRSKMLLRWLRSRFMGGALILGYHRISETSFDPYSICVRPKNFLEQIEVLRSTANIIPLQGLVHAIKEGKIPKKAVILTFDEGYADILFNVKPVLEKYRLPATVFMVTGNMGGTFWWDHLANTILNSERMPQSLNLSLNGTHFEWTSECQSNDKKEPLGKAPRNYLLMDLYHRLLPLSPEDQREVIKQLEETTGMVTSEGNIPRSLDPFELKELAEGMNFEIGAHSVNHPVLAQLPVDQQQFEIDQSKYALEEITQKTVTSFSYPNGSTLNSIRVLVQNAGFNCACASDQETAGRYSHLYQLPRFWIPDWDGETFSKWIRLWV